MDLNPFYSLKFSVQNLNILKEVAIENNAPINVKPEGGEPRGICGAFDLFCLPHPREFDLESGPQGGDVCFFLQAGLVASHVCVGHLGIHWSAGWKARLFFKVSTRFCKQKHCFSLLVVNIN